MKAEENLSKRIKDLEEKIHAIEKDRDLVKNEILNLESNGRIVYQSFSYIPTTATTKWWTLQLAFL